MKVLLSSLLVLVFSTIACASDTIELVGPGLTMHVIDGGVSDKYVNKISSNGRLILTPQIGIRKTNVDKWGTYNSLALFAARNSIGSPIYGGFGATGAEFFKFFDAGLVYGFYIQNDEDFRARGIEPFSMWGNTNAAVPLFGIELNVKIRIEDNVFIGFNNIITPILTNTSLSLGLTY